MKYPLLWSAIGFATTLAVHPLAPFDANLVYQTPFITHPQFRLDEQSVTRQIEAFKNHLERRQSTDANQFRDAHYPTFYGGDFSNAQFVWSGGINFTHSVASGDPLDTSVLIWTRAVPSSYALNPLSPVGQIPDQSIPVCVTYSVFTSSDLSGPRVASGHAFTSYDVDFTVKVEVTGLKPDKTYWYRFNDCTDSNSQSPVGRTRTFASPNTPPERVNGGKPLTLAVFSCSRYPDGYFNAYGFALRNTSTDVFIHLGDYIYEYGNRSGHNDGSAIGRPVTGRELATVADYRARLNLYRTDESLQHAHQNAPWITDDHEVADNGWKAGTANSNDTALGCTFSPSGSCFTDRKLAAVRAYHEWMPVRQLDADDKLRIWRNFQIGKLLDLTMLDTRHYERDVTDVYYNTEFVDQLSSYTNRSLMGHHQEQWFLDRLSSSKRRGAVWRVVGQQIVFSQLNNKGKFNLDAWDGYKANRKRILDHIEHNEIPNVVMLSGDSHANWVSDLTHPNDTRYDSSSGSGALGVEFAGTAVTSTSAFGAGISPAQADVISRVLVSAKGNEELQWNEGSYRGFFTLTISPSTMNATFYAMRNISYPNLDAFASAEFLVVAGGNKLSRPVAGGSVKAGVLKAAVQKGE